MKSLAEKIAERKATKEHNRQAQRLRSQEGTERGVARVRERAENFRAKIEERRLAGEKAAKAARIERNSQSRGVDRVPDHLRNLGNGQGEVIVEHTDASYAERRRRSLDSGRSMKPGMNQPHYRSREDQAQKRRGKRRRPVSR